MDSKLYFQDPRCLSERIECCPYCEAQKLWNNGSYPRQLYCTPGELTTTVVYRKLCPNCHTHFSLHPEFLLKRQRYSLYLVAAWLWSFFRRGASTRCREFYERHGISFRGGEPRISWTDQLDQPDSRTRPGYQLLNYWSHLFCHRAALLQEDLVKSVSELRSGLELASSWPCSKRARPLQLAWLHWLVLLRAESRLSTDEESAFLNYVRFLSQAPSHKARRAIPAPETYDVLIL